MNREIEFRGLRKDGKGWVYGDLLRPHDGNSSTYIMQRNGIEVEVLPETVGQFTGLKDKNDKKIFDGDIVEQVVGEYSMSIEWDNEIASWGMCFRLPECDPEMSKDFYVTDYIVSETGEFTLSVIGNIDEQEPDT
jgi:uncharacterized phage protein (TIGR01671 family)